MNVLICDDAGFIRELFRRAFETMPNIGCFEAEDGVEALRVLNQSSIELVFLDLVLPGRNGVEVAQQIKERFPELPIYAVSTLDIIQMNQAQEKQDLFKGFISKPFTKEKIWEITHHHIPPVPLKKGG